MTKGEKRETPSDLPGKTSKRQTILTSDLLSRFCPSNFATPEVGQMAPSTKSGDGVGDDDGGAVDDDRDVNDDVCVNETTNMTMSE